MELILLRYGGNDAVGYILMSVIIGIVIFLILREVACWYWKINERIELQQKQVHLLEQLLASKSDSKIIDDEHQRPAVESICVKCGFENKPDDIFCSNCGNKL